MEVLQWARQNGCQWDEDACRVAAEEGHLEVLQWARQNGCEWDETTCQAAASARPPGGVEVCASERVRVGRVDVL